MIGMLRGLGTTFKTMLRHPVTVQYPDEQLPVSPRRRGFPRLLGDPEADEIRCIGCGICARHCLNQALTVTLKDNPNFAAGKSTKKKIVDKFLIDLGMCSECAVCVEVCNWGGIEMTREWCPPSTSRRGLVRDLVAEAEARRVAGQ
ncbi:MAG: 4Fe-4S dicluster domain-containing protein [Chloroflexi bacterium]|nr:4Fe-4S dicluster domain-containing protein [Chloroflexota bacterium]